MDPTYRAHMGSVDRFIDRKLGYRNLTGGHVPSVPGPNQVSHLKSAQIGPHSRLGRDLLTGVIPQGPQDKSMPRLFRVRYLDQLKILFQLNLSIDLSLPALRGTPGDAQNKKAGQDQITDFPPHSLPSSFALAQ